MTASSDSRGEASGKEAQPLKPVEAAVSDTGPVLHLQEIDRLYVLAIFRKIEIPPLVEQELKHFGLGLARLGELGLANVAVSPVDELAWRKLTEEAGSQIHPADAQVAVLASGLGDHRPVLTDDLALRKLVEGRGGLVVGSVGLLVRAYKPTVGRTANCVNLSTCSSPRARSISVLLFEAM